MSFYVFMKIIANRIKKKKKKKKKKEIITKRRLSFIHLR